MSSAAESRTVVRDQTRSIAGNHFVQLDGLRAFAALSVILQHYSPAETYTRFPAGIAGVWLFFVLSGFLITGILVRARDGARGVTGGIGHAWKAFYLRRILRIFPLYYFVLLGTALLDLPGVRAGLLGYGGHVANFYGEFYGNAAPLPHFWSLAVEEQFYLIWPTIVLLAPRRVVIGTVVAMILAAPASRYLMLTATNSWSFAQALPPSCLDGLAMGALLAIFRETDAVSKTFRDRFGRFAAPAGLAIVAASLVSAFVDFGYRIPFAIRYSGYSLIAFWLINRAADGFRGWGKAVLEFPPLLYLGKISYGIYVIHMTIPCLIDWFRDRTGYGLGFPREAGWAQFFYITAVTIGLATLTWNLIEKPINDLKRFFPYRKKAGVPHARPVPASPVSTTA